MSGEKLRAPEMCGRSSRANSLSRSIHRARKKRGATSSRRSVVSFSGLADLVKRNDKSSALNTPSIAQIILRPKATVLQVTA